MSNIVLESFFLEISEDIWGKVVVLASWKGIKGDDIFISKVYSREYAITDIVKSIQCAQRGWFSQRQQISRPKIIHIVRPNPSLWTSMTGFRASAYFH